MAKSRSSITAVAILSAVVCLSAHELRAQDGSFMSSGAELYYRSAGNGSPIVFLSGGPGFDVDYVIPVADFFPATYRRIFFEQRGTGRSRVSTAPLTNMTLAGALADLEALRVHLKQDRLFLVGHSWGGMLGMAYATAHPNRVDRLILIDPGGPNLEFGDWFGDNIASRLHQDDLDALTRWDSSTQQGIDREEAAIERVRARVPGYFFDRSKALKFAAELKRGTYHADVNTALFADLAKNYDVRAGLGKFTGDVLIVHGHQDPIGQKVPEDLHRLLKQSTLKYIAKAGHFPWIEQPDEFGRIIETFLKDR